MMKLLFGASQQLQMASRYRFSIVGHQNLAKDAEVIHSNLEYPLQKIHCRRPYL